MQLKRTMVGTVTRLGVVAMLAAAGCSIPIEQPPLQPPPPLWGPPVSVMRFDASGAALGVQELRRPIRSEAHWRGLLGPVAYAVLRQAATELPQSSALAKPAPDGLYRCRGCGLGVFAAKAQFESDTGWPSFFEPLDARNVEIAWDLSWGVRRRAVKCALCGSHLGHVFADGPPPTYRRYCLNGAGLEFVTPQ